jgi:hypothetical protein
MGSTRRHPPEYRRDAYAEASRSKHGRSYA